MTPDEIKLTLKSDLSQPLSQRLEHPLVATGGRIQPDKLYTAAQVAVILGVAQSTMRRWRMEGRGPVVTRLFTNAPPRYRGLHIIQALDDAAEA